MKKAEVARTLAWLLTEPDEEMVEALNAGEIYHLFHSYFRESNGEGPLLNGFLPQADQTRLLAEMKEEYLRLFQDPALKDLWWVESAHKPWTNDPECRLSIAREKGLVMGDSALHMLDLYQSLGIEIPEGFNGFPDHIVLELEFLAILLESPSEEGVRIFIKDHLDWTSKMVKQGTTCCPSAFYVSVFEALERFIKSLRKSVV